MPGRPHVHRVSISQFWRWGSRAAARAGRASGDRGESVVKGSLSMSGTHNLLQMRRGAFQIRGIRGVRCLSRHSSANSTAYCLDLVRYVIRGLLWLNLWPLPVGTCVCMCPQEVWPWSLSLLSPVTTSLEISCYCTACFQCWASPGEYSHDNS